jgi:hypothetical protein
MVKELTKEQLGASYRIATTRLHDLITDFYEELFDEDGDPRYDSGNISRLISGMRLMINQELGFVESASFEYLESKLDGESKQEEILFGDGKSS